MKISLGIHFQQEFCQLLPTNECVTCQHLTPKVPPPQPPHHTQAGKHKTKRSKLYVANFLCVAVAVTKIDQQRFNSKQTSKRFAMVTIPPPHFSIFPGWIQTVVWTFLELHPSRSKIAGETSIWGLISGAESLLHKTNNQSRRNTFVSTMHCDNHCCCLFNAGLLCLSAQVWWFVYPSLKLQSNSLWTSLSVNQGAQSPFCFPNLHKDTTDMSRAW